MVKFKGKGVYGAVAIGKISEIKRLDWQRSAVRISFRKYIIKL